MVNIYNLIQKIASMNGYNTEIPVIFLEATIITDSGITSPDSSIVFISKGNAELRSKLDRQRPLWRVFMPKIHRIPVQLDLLQRMDLGIMVL